MKKLFAALYIVGIYLVCLTATTSIAYAEAEVKEICKDKLDNAGKTVMKDGKAVQSCKKIKVHKKLEGTEVPVKK